VTKYEFPSFTGLAIIGNNRQYPTNAECPHRQSSLLPFRFHPFEGTACRQGEGNKPSLDTIEFLSVPDLE